MYNNIHFCKDVVLHEGVKIAITDGGSLNIGEKTCIDRFTNIRVNGGHVTIGANSYIGDFCYVASNKNISIGKGALIASHVVIRDNQHKCDDISTPIHLQGNDCQEVSIGENVWLGTKVSVLKGVSIGRNTIIGAHSLVNKNLDQDFICAGTPCRQLRKR